ncbi:MAG: hypothetical protein ACYTG1_06260 [Planctomycetota bacterium]|jgi:hypothetical protein
MKTTIILSGLAVTCTAVLVGQLAADPDRTSGGIAPVSLDRDGAPTAGTAEGVAMAGGHDGNLGCDIQVSNLGGGQDYAYYGQSGSKRLFTMASTSCNTGTQVCDWIDGSSGRHPLIAQNLYMLDPATNRFSQIGLSMLKHSFCAVSEPTCGSCQGTGCGTLGIGCADTYWATLNGNGLGARVDIDPEGFGTTGGISNTHSHPYTGSVSPYFGRMPVDESHVGVPGARYFSEVQYVSEDEPMENRYNNTSWREVTLNLTSMSNTEPDSAVQDDNHFGPPALRAWQLYGSGVSTASNVSDSENPRLEIPGAGTYHLYFSATDNGDGTWHYEFAVHNLNSNDPAVAFEIPLLDCVASTNVDHQSPEYQAPEPYNNNVWASSHGGGVLRWDVDSVADPASNKIHWGTLDNFGVDTDTTPGSITGKIILESGLEIPVQVRGPRSPSAACAEDCDWTSPATPGACPNDLVDVSDLLEVLAQWDTTGGCDADGSGSVDVGDLLAVLAVWGTCP